ncbi:MAG TPA: ABC transporter permease [Hyphomicrobiaceae bacterium]|nr:ABC transporter permease [Hyphomicrobiaceae bacterium]
MTAAASATLRKAGATSAGIVLIRVAAWLVLGLLLAPLIVLVGASFSSVDYVSFPPRGFSLQWYEKFFADPAFVNSLILSAKIALAASLLATLLGFPAAYILVRKRFPGRKLAWTLLLSPLLVPQIILGVALLQIFTAAGLATSFTGLLLAHTVAVVPYVVRTVGAALVGIDPSIEEAAADLGASRLEILALVVAPIIKGGLLAGALFAFIMSWVNVEISIFLSVTGGYTLPVVLFNFIEYSITTVVVAAASIAIYVALILVLMVDAIVGIDSASKL